MKRFTIVLVIAFTGLSLLEPVAHASGANTTRVVAGIGSGAAVAGYAATPAGSSSGSSATSTGPLVPAWVGCSLKPATYTQSAAHLENGFFSSGTVQDTVVTTQTAAAITVQSSSTVQDVNVLHGLITASQIRAVVSSSGTKNGAQSSNNSYFLGLKVAGIPKTSSVAPNTTIQFAGLGYVILNEQNGPFDSFAATSINITMIDLYVTTPNLLGLDVGTRIVVAQAVSAFVRTGALVALGARAYSFNAVGMAGVSGASSGAYLSLSLGCAGGNQQAQVNSSSFSTVGNTGQVSDSVSGQITPSISTATARANLSNVNLLQGLIQGEHISLVAHAQWNGTGSATATMTLTNFNINRKPVQQSPSRNTRITLPGIGYLILNEQYRSVSSSGVTVTVIALDIYITQNHVPGLPIGARIILGYADASVRR